MNTLEDTATILVWAIPTILVWAILKLVLLLAIGEWGKMRGWWR